MATELREEDGPHWPARVLARISKIGEMTSLTCYICHVRIGAKDGYISQSAFCAISLMTI